ncbi:TraR/DksA C4-type zinc finger protein [Streptomyces sp. NPDC006654]|uniref:TraR/DksA family transcriptional regulator n=1 Tax=unclassified Streptomyces TaxID=2593676 RepID=UPI0033C675FF
MVAKKTAVQQSASGRSRGAAASDSGEKRTAKKTAAPKAPAKKPPVKKATTGKTTGKPVTGKPATAAAEHVVDKAAKGGSKAAASKSTAKKSTGKKAGAARAAKQTGATTVVAKKTPGTAAAAAETAVPKARVATAAPDELAVRPGEDPWTPEEVAEARTELTTEAMRLRTEIETSENALAGLMRDSGDGAGDDEADTGTKNITREHELALAANAREMLEQTERALQKLDAGTYGLCENCGNPIGKARMQAFPRATLCVECKQKQERRY